MIRDRFECLYFKCLLNFIPAGHWVREGQPAAGDACGGAEGGAAAAHAAMDAKSQAEGPRPGIENTIYNS